MNTKKMMALFLSAGLAAASPVMTMGEEATEEVTESAVEATNSENQLSAPEDFKFNPETGDFSFTATDEKTGYYFVRFYQLNDDGTEKGEYVASSKRINGGKTGEITGQIDISKVAWGEYHANLSSFAAAGSGYDSPDAITEVVRYGVDQSLERPELLVMSSGNQVEVVFDWWTLCDYAFTQYMPKVELKFYSNAECTQEVQSDEIDLSELMETLRKNPPGLIYIWGWSTVEGSHYYTAYNPDGEGTMFSPTEKTFAFKNDIYTYTMDPGTYYVTAQALTKDEYTKSSQVSSPVEFTLTDGEPTEEFEFATSELWKDPMLMDMPGANPGQQPERVDTAASQGISAEIVAD